MKERGLIVETDDDLVITKKGMLWTDNMAMEFINSREQQRIWKIAY
jgi:coproporphyrinogen III oxidase-like Fe-S oxidoreductase